MDHNLLPPLPSAEELFALSTSQSPSSSLPFLKNVNLFMSIPPLPPPAAVPPVPPDSVDYTEPNSPIPPQPTSPLVDQFDFQFGGSKTSNAVHQMFSQRLISGSPPPSKKARYSQPADAVSTPEPSSVLQYDSREEGEISDESDDIDQVITPASVCTTLYHKPPASRLAASGSEQASHISASHRRPSTSSSQNIAITLPSSGHHRQSRTSDATRRSSHHRHHRARHSHDEEASKLSSRRHHQSVDAASSYKTERSSSSRKQSAVHSDGHKVEDHSKGSSRVSIHHRLSSDRTAGVETAKHESQSSSHSDRRTGSSSALDPSPLTSGVHRHGISSVASQSSRLKHRTLDSSTLVSEIVKNMSESSAGQKPSAGFSRAKNAFQPPSVQRQLTSDAAVNHTVNNQQQSVNSGKTSSSFITGTDEEKLRNCLHHSTRQSDSTKDVVTRQSSCHESNLPRESATVETTEKPASQKQKHVTFGNTAGDGRTTSQLSVVSRHPSQSHSGGQQSPRIPAAHRPHPAGSATELATTHHHTSVHLHTLCPKSDLDAPYSPGSLEPDILFEPSVVSGRQEAVSNDDKTGSKTDTLVVPYASLVPNTAPNSNAVNTSVEDSDVEVDTADVVEETSVAEDVEGVAMTAESAVVEGRGQEYEIIDDLDSNADEMDDNAGASSDNSEMEYNSGDEENSPVKPIKMHHNHRPRQSGDRASKQTWNDLEPFDEDGDEDFQAPLVNHKIVLHGECWVCFHIYEFNG